MKIIKKEFVSVIIPSYNRAWSLGDAIDSVLAQTHEDFEIIVVDDGSFDHTPELLAKYRAEHGEKIQVYSQANTGVSAARNLGIRKSRGQLVALLDSDDTWEKDKLACQTEFFEKHPDAQICQTEEIWIRKGRRVNPGRRHKKPSGMIFEDSLHLCLVSPSAVMMRKTLLEKKGLFNEKFPVCEDYDLWLRIASDTPVYLIDKPCTIKYGGHDDQLSSFHSQDKYRIASILDLIRRGELTEAQEKAAEKVLEKKCRIYANGCIKRGRTNEGEYYLGICRWLLGEASLPESL